VLHPHDPVRARLHTNHKPLVMPAGPVIRQQQAYAGSRGPRQRCGPCRAAATIFPSAKPPPAAQSTESTGPEELSSVYYEAGGLNVKALREENGEPLANNPLLDTLCPQTHLCITTECGS
jgi:hypothetical protein